MAPWIPDAAIILSLVAVPWVAFWDLLFHGGWVSDDILGIATYHGTLRKPVPRDQVQPPKEAWKEGQLDLCFGNLFTYARWHLGKVYNPQWKKDPKQPKYVASPRKHHIISNTLASATAVLAWAFLSRFVGEWVAFLTVMLWMVHPMNVQVTGWISGIGYLCAAFFMFLGLNWAQWVLDHGWLTNPLLTLLATGIYCVFQGLAGRCQFTSILVTGILTWLGWWPFLVPAVAMALFELSQTFMNAVMPRMKTFQDQKMGASTTFHGRKLIVVCKTWYYYLRLAIWPKRLGLYHVFGYHYPLPETEQEDRYFWFGLLLILAWAIAIWVLPTPLSFGLFWYGCFLFFVLNWITVHQFVTERYVWIPVLGLCLTLSGVLPLWAWTLVFGVAITRSWVHLPTYYNEIQFYQSNLWNFPSSEVAAGNLGVSYLRMGLVGSAIDAWSIGTKMNAEYDVNWYNLFSTYRSQGLVDLARQCLVKAISAPTCHFPQQWTYELHRFDAEAGFLRAASAIPDPQRLDWMKAQLARAVADPKIAFPELWKDLMKRVEQELAKHPPAPPPPPPIPGSNPMGPIVDATTA